MKNKIDAWALYFIKAFHCDLQYITVRQERNVNLRSFIYLADKSAISAIT